MESLLAHIVRVPPRRVGIDGDGKLHAVDSMFLRTRGFSQTYEMAMYSLVCLSHREMCSRLHLSLLAVGS